MIRIIKFDENEIIERRKSSKQEIYEEWTSEREYERDEKELERNS